MLRHDGIAPNTDYLMVMSFRRPRTASSDHGWSDAGMAEGGCDQLICICGINIIGLILHKHGVATWGNESIRKHINTSCQ